MKKSKRHSVRMLCLSALICTLLILSATLFRFPLPGTDVLFTLQVAVMLLCGLLLPLKYALYAVGGYIVLGLMGLPVFSSVCGPGAVFTPSFGYLLGFPFAVWTEHLILQRKKTAKSRDLIAALCGMVIMYTVALAYISFLRAVWLKDSLGIKELLLVYVVHFLPMDILKAMVSAFVAPRIRRALFRA